jgi:hypothetical protein
LGGEVSAYRAKRAHRTGEHTVLRGNPAQGDPSFDLFDSPWAALGAGSAGGAAPDLLVLDLGQSERSLPDDLPHTEGPNTIPRADNVAQAALVAQLERVASLGFDDLNDVFERGYSFHFSFNPLLCLSFSRRLSPNTVH